MDRGSPIHSSAHVHVHTYNVHVHVHLHIHKHTHTQCTVPLAGYPVKLQPSLFRKAMAFSTFPLRANDEEGFLSTNGISEFAMRRYMYVHVHVCSMHVHCKSTQIHTCTCTLYTYCTLY